MMESDKYSESDILNLNSYEEVLDVGKIIESDFINFIWELELKDEEKQILKRLFYKYSVSSYKLKECELDKENDRLRQELAEYKQCGLDEELENFRRFK